MHLLQRVREVLEDQDRPRARVPELVLELARRVQRVGVDHRQPGAERADDRHRVLQDVRQHDGDAVALLQARHLLQVGRELAAQPVEVAVGERPVHQRVGRAIRELREAVLDERLQRGDLVRVDLGRHAGGVVPEPDLVHVVPLCRSLYIAAPAALFIVAATASACGHTWSSSFGCAAAFGCRPSSCISASSSATPSRKNGTRGSRCLPASSPIQGVEVPGVGRAVVRGDAHADQQHAGAGLARQLDQRLEIAPHVRDRQSTQAVVATQLDDDDRRPVPLQRPRQPRQRAAGGLAARAGVDHPVPVPFGLQTALQQGHPPLFEPDPVGRAQAVPEHQDRRGLRPRGRSEQARAQAQDEAGDADEGHGARGGRGGQAG